ncbi:FAD-binding oxidoreductase [Aspergillus mulundensis]|uniref:FAD-binding PCMH-type domain-containing protein n=1 Tax=Aspergillus mulundensis TaxID=1810919 RepID=A0A3D8T345_9EURO|nr:Uncharacterized protein DSM5745_00296 [Aspergillus mulundensis]RDW92974.1 Uncharacterized protein DSM5745_00296 [Aspergillus mulundensis]
MRSIFKLLPALALLATPAVVNAAAGDSSIDFHALFRPVLSEKANIYTTGDTGYPGVNERWSNLQNPSFVAAIQPATEQDVANTVRTAVAHNISFLATGSAHSVKPGYKSVKGAVNIDLSLLKNIFLDYPNDTVTIGPGVTNNQVYNVVYDVQRELPLSTDKCISTLGTMIGGGLGTLQGVRGILAETLMSARLVTATGELLTVSPTSHAPLFWALRGAGANFGILVSATFRMFPQTNSGWSLYGDFTIPAENNASAFELIRSVDDSLTHGVFWGILGGFNRSSMTPTMSLRLMVYGDEAFAAPHIAKARALHPTRESWANTTWNTYGEPSAIMCDRGWSADMWSTGLARTDVDALVEIWGQWTAFAAENEWFNGLWMQERHSEEALLAVPQEERGVYPWRDTKVNLVFVNYIEDARYEAQLHEFIRPLRDRVQETMGFEHRHAYVNEAYGDEGPEVWYGAHNLPRLVALKQQWDPEGRFGAGMPIPLTL